MFTCLFDVIGYALPESMCLSTFCHVSCLDLHSYMSIHLDSCCLYAKFLHVYMHVSMPICLYLCFHMLVCLDLCSLHDLFHFPCDFALYTIFMCLNLGYVCHVMCYYSPFVALYFFLVFWPIGLDQI